MAPRIQIINPISGSICIDSSARNYVLAQKGTRTSVAKPTGSGAVYVNPGNVSVSGVGGNFGCPIFAYRSTVRVGIRPSLSYQAVSLTSTSAWTFDLWFDAPPGATLDFWIFDLPFNGMVVDSTSALLRTKDSAGNVFFDSRMRPMRVMGATANLTSNSNTEQSTNLASLNTNFGTLASAISFNGQGFERLSGVNYSTVLASRWSGDTLYYKYLKHFGVIQAGNNAIGTATGRQLILDVKDY